MVGSRGDRLNLVKKIIKASGMGRKIAAIAFSLGCLHAGSVMALGLGELTLESFLNEPLKARVDLLNTGSLHADEIKIRLATKEDFEKLGLDRAYFLTGIKFDVEIDANGGPRIVVSSDDPVLEPYLDFIVEARWPTGRLLREYTVLVDPPVFDRVNPVVSASTRVEEVEGIAAPVKKTEQGAASDKSGTHVALKKSDLAPGAMPQRDFSAETAGSPGPGQRYMIHRDDTLWEIARQARPEGASVHQTMLDIQRLNPKAFIDGNINRIKAGYIVYLPSAADISSADLEAALAQVRQQNDDWRAGKASEPLVTAGPSLRISANEPEELAETASPEERESAASSAAMEEMDKVQLEEAEADGNLAAMEQQVETLNRIVNLKDEQIAALQAALAESQGVAADTAEAELAQEMVAEEAAVDTSMISTEESVAEESVAEEMAQEVAAVEDTGVAVEPEVEVVEEEAQPVVAPVAAKPVPAAEPAADKSGGMMSNILYILGAAVLAILAFVFMRRRGDDDDDAQKVAATTATTPADVFADVELKEQPLEVEALADPTPEPTPEPLPTEAAEASEGPTRDNRGYGERKHDEYATDDETGDALAEADIYIAYGRYPQAIDLLNNAITNEPGNSGYHLKLLELFAETGDRDAAQRELGELQNIGDADSVARAELVISQLGQSAEVDEGRRFIDPAPAAEEATPLDLLAETDAPLEADFTGLEIEEIGDSSADSSPEDLDLSADFSDSELTQGADEDLVIAADSNALSTKLDLARAYLDMGDDDGARQILEEVVAEGTDELKAEASALLDRIG